MLSMDFPSRKPLPATAPQIILDAFPYQPIEILRDRDYLLVFENEAMIRNMNPDRLLLDQINLDPGGICITAKGNEADFVSRFFAPSAGVPEDPVTGSAHCCLTPYWADKLGKTEMLAYQASARGGIVRVCLAGARVLLSGQAVTVMRAELLA